jgi:hypothetical protein
MNILKYVMGILLIAFVVMPFVYGDDKNADRDGDTCNSNTTEQQLLEQMK